MPAPVTLVRSTYGPNDSVPYDQFNAVAVVSATVPDATAIALGVIQLAGDLTGSAASPAVANGAITLAKMANLAQYNLIGRQSAGSGAPELIPITAYTLGLLNQATAALARTTLGSTTVGDALFTAASAAVARTTLGSTTVGDAVFTAASAAAARTTLGSTTVGDALFTTASAAAARTTLGLGNSAILNVGTVASTVCAGDDSRLANSRQCNNNFDDAATARANLGLGDAATHNAADFDASGAAAALKVAARTITGGTNVYFEINGGAVGLFIDSTFLGFISTH